MPQFAALAELAEQLAATASRLKKRAAIAQAIAAVHRAAPSSDDAGLFAMYLAGTPFAESDARKLNAGGALLSKAVLAVSGATDAALTAAYRRHGDLGAAAFDLLQSQSAQARPGKPPTLALADRPKPSPQSPLPAPLPPALPLSKTCCATQPRSKPSTCSNSCSATCASA